MKRLAGCIAAIVLFAVLTAVPFTAVHASDEQSLPTESLLLQEEVSLEKGPMPYQEYLDKANAFIADERWKDGTKWENNKRPVLSPYSAIGCAAYAADFAAYMYGSDTLRGGEHYEGDPEQIRSGDIVYVQYHSNGGAAKEHWFIVLERDGDTLYTAEGAYGGKTQVRTDFYYLSGGEICCQMGKDFKLVDGYHYPIEEVEASAISGLRWSLRNAARGTGSSGAAQ